MLKKYLSALLIALLTLPQLSYGITTSLVPASLTLTGGMETDPGQYAFPDYEIVIDENEKIVSDISVYANANQLSSSEIQQQVFLENNVDDSKFEINSSGQLAFILAPDFENPTDGLGSVNAIGGTTQNTYRTGVRFDDSGTKIGYNVIVTVNNVNETPEILLNNGQAIYVAMGLDVTGVSLATELGTTTYAIDFKGASSQEVTATATITYTGNPTPQVVVVPVETYTQPINIAQLFDDFVQQLGGQIQAGEYVVLVEATSEEASTTQEVTVTVENEVPEIEYAQGSSTVEIIAKDAQALQSQLNAIANTFSASNDDTATVTVQVQIDGGTPQTVIEEQVTGDISYDVTSELTPFTNQALADGQYDVSVVVEDEAGQTAVQTIRITIQNSAPVIEFNNGDATQLNAVNLQDVIAQMEALAGGPDYEFDEKDGDQVDVALDLDAPGQNIDVIGFVTPALQGITNYSFSIGQILTGLVDTASITVLPEGQYEATITVRESDDANASTTELFDTQTISLTVAGTSTTDVVRPSDLAFGNPAQPTNSWYFADETPASPTPFSTSTQTGDYEMVVGPNPTPLGEGSVRFEKTGTERFNIATNQYAGTRLATIQELSFSTYNDSADGTNDNFFMTFDIDFDGTQSDGYQGRLSFVPAQQAPGVTEDIWQEWDVTQGTLTWSRFSQNGNQWPDGSTSPSRTWADIVATNPNAELLFETYTGQMLIRAGGSNSPTAPVLVGYADKVVFKADNVQNITDFEPEEATLELVVPQSDDIVDATTTTVFVAQYDDNDTNQEDIAFAVRKTVESDNGSCSNRDVEIAFGNGSGYVWNAQTGEITFEFDSTGYESGEYCFVVNPQEETGQVDLRAITEFFLRSEDNTVPSVTFNTGENLQVSVSSLEQLSTKLTATTSLFTIVDIDHDQIMATATVTLSDGSTSTIDIDQLGSQTDGALEIDIASVIANQSGPVATGTYTVSVAAEDDRGAISSPYTVTIQVVDNVAPVIEYNNGEDQSIKVKDAQELIALLTASTSEFVVTDVDGDDLTATTTITLSEAASSTVGTSTIEMVFTGTAGELRIDIEQEINAIAAQIATGTYEIVIAAADEMGNSASTSPMTITVEVTGETNPEFTSFGGAASTTIFFSEGQTISIQTEAIDEDEDVLKYSLASSSDPFEISTSTGLITALSAITAGQYTIIAQVSDGSTTTTDIDDTQEINLVIEAQIINNNSSSGSSGGGGGGGSNNDRVCKDPEASNYERVGRSTPSLCEYNSGSQSSNDENEQGTNINSGNSGSNTGQSNGNSSNTSVDVNTNTGAAGGVNEGVFTGTVPVQNVDTGNDFDTVAQSNIDATSSDQTDSTDNDNNGETSITGDDQQANILGAIDDGEENWAWLLFVLSGLIVLFIWYLRREEEKNQM